MTKKTKHPVTFMFAIDNTLAFQISSADPWMDMQPFYDYFGKEYTRELHIAGFHTKEHFLAYPGMLELWRMLRNKGHRCGFFGSGHITRDRKFAFDFLDSAHDCSGIDSWKDFKTEKARNNTCVLSGCHTVHVYKGGYDYERYASMFDGYQKKPLENLVSTREELPNTLLIDVTKSVVAKGEEYNYVAVPFVSPFQVTAQTQREKYRNLFKACYLAGIFQRIFNAMESDGLTAAEAAKKVQIDSTGKTFDENFDYPTMNDIAIYREGYYSLFGTCKYSQPFALPEIFQE